MKHMIFLSLLLPGMALADELRVETPVIPVAPPSAMAHAAYMVLHNETDTGIELIGVQSEAYGMVHLHSSSETDGVATMTAVDVISIKPGQSVALAPGGLHVMLMRPQAPRAEGDTVPLVLEYADGTTQTVTATVIPRSAMPDFPGDHGS